MTDSESSIFHIVRRSDWQAAVSAGSYAPPSLQSEGFIHCSTLTQVVDTASRWYRGQADLLLLHIDARRLNVELKLELPRNPADPRRAERFPHLYGPLELDAVHQVLEFPCEPDGSFRLPAALRGGA